jgi:hypothetical protein
MKKFLIILASLSLLSAAIYLGFYLYINQTSKKSFTQVSVKNSSKQDSILVYLTIQAPNSVVGIFGITDTIGSCSKGTFYAKKDSTYTTNLSKPLLGAVISFGGDAMPCEQAISKGFRWGVNIFECSINVPFECFDLSCEDGVNSIIKVKVSDTLWTTGDGQHIARFDSIENKFPVEDNINIRGVFPYRCTDCIDLGKAVPQNCLNLPDSCSKFRTCQVARTNNNGGNIIVEYLDSPQILK